VAARAWPVGKGDDALPVGVGPPHLAGAWIQTIDAAVSGGAAAANRRGDQDELILSGDLDDRGRPVPRNAGQSGRLPFELASLLVVGDDAGLGGLRRHDQQIAVDQRILPIAHCSSWALPPKSFQMFLRQTGFRVFVLMACKSPIGPTV
jgi:hypothetical protein